MSESMASTTPATLPPATRIVTVRKPDGTLVRVKKPVDPNEKAPESSGAPAPRPNSSTTTMLVKKPDGTVVRVKRPGAAQNTAGESTIAPSAANESPAGTALPTIQVHSSQATKPTVLKDQPISSLPQLEHSVDDVRKRKRRVNRTYNILSKTASLYPSDLTTSEGHHFDHDDLSVGSNSDYDSHDSDNDSKHGGHLGGSRDKDNRQNSNASEDHGKLGAPNAKTAAQTMARATGPNAKAAEMSVFKPRADSLDLKKPAAKPAAAPEIETMNEKTREMQPQASSAKPTGSGSKPGVGVSEKEVYPTDSAEEDKKKPRRREPRELGRRTSKLAQGVAWGVALSFPILFIILAIMNASIRGRMIGDVLAERLLRLNKIAVSIWPILFAAVVAQSLRMFAAYKVERGIRLITLEQLIGSHSLATSVKQPFFLQTINWLSVGLLILWGLSPLGGQSLQYLQYHAQNSATFNDSVTVIDLSSSASGFAAGSTEISNYAAQLDALLSAALVSDQYNPYTYADLWNNTKMPSLEIQVMQGIEPVDNWYQVGWPNPIHYPSPFPSLLGLPISRKQTWQLTTEDHYYDNSIVNFTIPYSYYQFTCQAAQNRSLAELKAATDWSLYDKDYDATEAFSTDAGNTTWMGIIPTSSPTDGVFFFAQNLTAGITCPDTFDDPSECAGYGHVAFSNCSYEIVQIDVYLSCKDSEACEAKKIRHPSLLATTPEAVFTRGFAASLVTSLGTPSIGLGFSSVVANYIADPSTALVTASTYAEPDWLGLDAETTARRLGTLVNSYWQVGFAPDFQGNGSWDATGAEQQLYHYRNVTGVYVAHNNIYGIHWAWFCVLIFCSVLLLVAGVAGIIFDYRTIGPDIVGFASSITRDNRYMKLASHSSVAGGVERARALKDVEVMLQDVRADQEVGRIALGTVEGNDGAGRLQRGRLYR